MTKAVKSTDPRKSKIVKAFKKATGADKVTEIKETSEGVFTGRTFKSLGSRRYEFLGEATVTILKKYEPPVLKTKGFYTLSITGHA